MISPDESVRIELNDAGGSLAHYVGGIGNRMGDVTHLFSRRQETLAVPRLGR